MPEVVDQYSKERFNFKKDYKKIVQLSLYEKHFTADQFMNPAEKDCFKL